MSVLDKALQYATQAITEDGAQNYESAYHLYGSAVSEMELAYHSLFLPPQTKKADNPIMLIMTHQLRYSGK